MDLEPGGLKLSPKGPGFDKVADHAMTQMAWKVQQSMAISKLII